MFESFNLSARAYARRAETLLREARFAQLEHQAAAEHHEALARMYAARVARLEGTHPSPTSIAPLPTEALHSGEHPPFHVLGQVAGNAAPLAAVHPEPVGPSGFLTH